MSRSLVKQALELCNSDDDMSNGMKSKYENKKNKNLKTKGFSEFIYLHYIFTCNF
jgi:hypothetical protein